ncbi:MAG: endospore germination permease [Epulopiscium sp.]|nr:endospore germination permease [Candidatus Epulonipiscium sp.]
MNKKHFMYFIWATTIISLKTYPTVFIQNGKRDTWVGMIIASAIYVFFTLYLVYIMKKSKTYSLLEIYEKALGKYLGSFLFFMLLFSFFCILIESASIEANSMHTNMLIKTPPWYLLLFFVIPAIYTVRQNIYTILMLTIIGILFIMAAGINLGIQTLLYKTPSWIFPIFENGITKGFILSTIQMIGLYSHIMIPIYLFQYVSNKKSSAKSILFALFIVVQMEVVSSTGLFMTFSMPRLLEMYYPKLIQTQLPSYFDFIEFGELLVMIQMIGGWYLKYTITFFVLLDILKKEYKKQHPALIYIITALVLFISYWLSRDIFTLFKFLDFFTYFSFVQFFVFPLLVFTLFHMRQNIQLKETITDQEDQENYEEDDSTI